MLALGISRLIGSAVVLGTTVVLGTDVVLESDSEMDSVATLLTFRPVDSRRATPSAAHIRGDEPGASPSPFVDSGPKPNHSNNFAPRPDTVSAGAAAAIGASNATSWAETPETSTVVGASVITLIGSLMATESGVISTAETDADAGAEVGEEVGPPMRPAEPDSAGESEPRCRASLDPALVDPRLFDP